MNTRTGILSFVTTWGLMSALYAQAEAPAIEDLRTRLDITELLGAHELATVERLHKPTGRAGLDFEGLLKAVEQARGVAPQNGWSRKSMLDGQEAADSDEVSVFVEPRTGDVRVRDVRGYASASHRSVSDAELVERSRPVMAALGATSGETKYEIRTLGAFVNSADRSEPSVEEVARKVIVRREIGGVQVEGDRVVLSFAMDGTLRKVLGHWHPVGFGLSKLTTSLSRSEATERALQRIEAESSVSNLGIATEGRVRIRTVLVPVETTDGLFVLVPKGRVSVPTVGPGQTVTTVLDFDL